jgi:transposase-like protein
MSDAHSGLKKGTGRVLQDTSGQRCPVHFMRNILAVASKASPEVVAFVIGTGFAQPDAEHIQKRFTEVVAMSARSHSKVAAMLEDVQHDLFAFTTFR